MTSGDPKGNIGHTIPRGRSASQRTVATLLAGTLPALFALSACGGKTSQGGLEITITTSGLQVGKDFDAIEAIVEQRTPACRGDPSPGSGWCKLFDRTASVASMPPEITLPTTLAVVPGTSPNQLAHIEVTALSHGVPVVQRVIEVQVPSDRVESILVVLAADCLGKITMCLPGSCQPATGGCGPPGPILPADAGLPEGDSSVTPDATIASDADVIADSGSDSGSCGKMCLAGQICESGRCGNPPSCQPGGPGMTNCGPGGSGTESCCTTLGVTGGMFYRRYTNDGSGPTGEADPATVSTFRLDKYEVTVGRFRQFVSAWKAGWLPAAGSGKHTYLNSGNGLNANGGGYEPGWVKSDDSKVMPTNPSPDCPAASGTWTASAGANENLPINCVSWYEANAFCVWDGGFLPSEAEWGYAAAGGTEQREYPWGNADPGTGSQYAIYNCYYPSVSTTCSPARAGNIAPVGTTTLGAGLWHQLDLGGNVWEWTLDWYVDPYVNPCVDCTQSMEPPTASYKEIRGGGFIYATARLLSANRDTAPYQASSDTGLRCARAP